MADFPYVEIDAQSNEVEYAAKQAPINKENIDDINERRVTSSEIIRELATDKGLIGGTGLYPNASATVNISYDFKNRVTLFSYSVSSPRGYVGNELTNNTISEYINLNLEYIHIGANVTKLDWNVFVNTTQKIKIYNNSNQIEFENSKPDNIEIVDVSIDREFLENISKSNFTIGLNSNGEITACVNQSKITSTIFFGNDTETVILGKNVTSFAGTFGGTSVKTIYYFNDETYAAIKGAIGGTDVSAVKKINSYDYLTIILNNLGKYSLTEIDKDDIAQRVINEFDTAMIEVLGVDE